MTKPILHVIRELNARAEKLREASAAFGVAAEAYEGATRYGSNGDLLEFLWSLVEREAREAERILRERQ